MTLADQEKQKNSEVNVYMEQKGKSFLGVLSDILLVILIIVAIIITVMTFTSKSSETGIGNILGYTPFSVQTDSMSPTIDQGDQGVNRTKGDTVNDQLNIVVSHCFVLSKHMKQGKR